MAARLIGALAVAALLAVTGSNAQATDTASRRCPVTAPPARRGPSPAPFSPAAFNYGNRLIRVALPAGGRLVAGVLPGGGVMAVINRDGSISEKLGWWRGVPGNLVIRGHRLDGQSASLRVDVPPTASYGTTGFIPSMLTYPTVGCWQVVGRQGRASLAFVLKVSKVKHG